MCERYSWIEKDGNVLFLTPDQVYNSKRGRELRKHTKDPQDYHGHGAIRFYYNLENGKEKECEDFSTPDNFPPVLAEAIKSGIMWGFGITNEMLVILTQPARAEYEKIEQQALAEYKKIEQPARAEYEKIRQQAFSKIFADPQNRIECWR